MVSQITTTPSYPREPGPSLLRTRGYLTVPSTQPSSSPLRPCAPPSFLRPPRHSCALPVIPAQAGTHAISSVWHAPQHPNGFTQAASAPPPSVRGRETSRSSRGAGLRGVRAARSLSQRGDAWGRPGRVQQSRSVLNVAAYRSDTTRQPGQQIGVDQRRPCTIGPRIWSLPQVPVHASHHSSPLIISR